MLFFQLMTRRYERASTVLASNKGFEEWGEVFGDEVMAAASSIASCTTLASSRFAATAIARGTTPNCGKRCRLLKTRSRRRADAAAVRRWRRPEARPLADVRFHPADLSDFRPALTPFNAAVVSYRFRTIDRHWRR